MSTAPVLSTPAENLFEQVTPANAQSGAPRISDEQLYIQYEIQRTVREIREHGWRRIALQFPDEMLGDGPRVSERLAGELRRSRLDRSKKDDGKLRGKQLERPQVDKVADQIEEMELTAENGRQKREDEVEERLTILADTSYGACCIDEIAAEHVDADVVVHYGRTCLSPTARLPVIYVFTSKPLDLDAAVASFRATYEDKTEKICLMADVPYSHHVTPLAELLQNESYTNVFATGVIHDPASLLPNRTIPSDVQEHGPDRLKEYSIFHISTPPTSLLLVLTSRVKNIHIYPTDTINTTCSAIQPAVTSPILRRRYALLTRIPSTPILGILINTLSVRNYLSALSHCQNLISAAGKKSYTFVVGKLNAAKLANFSEVGVWVVIGCWESSLVESKDFYAPVVTPFELEVALKGDEVRQWGGEWVADFGALLGREPVNREATTNAGSAETKGSKKTSDDLGKLAADSDDWADQASDDEPPDFDLRTGRYVSNTRPMPRARPSTQPVTNAVDGMDEAGEAPPSSALVQRAKADLATINGAVSPAAEFLRSKRTWQGLGSDYEVQYERDEDGKIRGATMEEGRGGVAKGYAVGADVERT
ncbi:Diphthamide biosynthesis protein 2 [Extremus antarcticus]|uniref:2-(3-amino-3-carboxypropyl)histidine synthase subunit 2 n=1 Tax=Extremus antarcticus TaxID=702011 RepID=A0AAJ0DBA0_9PEZI|nr:Diphthamide biosynthesis protein 2 [Extremus antarcticus]